MSKQHEVIMKLSRDDILLILRGLDALNINQYAYKTEYAAERRISNTLHRELNVIEIEEKYGRFPEFEEA